MGKGWDLGIFFGEFFIFGNWDLGFGDWLYFGHGFLGWFFLVDG